MKQPAATLFGGVRSNGGEQKKRRARLRRSAQLNASGRARGSPGGAVPGAGGQEPPRTATGFSFHLTALLTSSRLYLHNK